MTKPTTTDLVERVARQLREHELDIDAGIGNRDRIARAIIEEVAAWVSEQRTAEENHESFGAKAYVSSLIATQTQEEG